MNKIISAEFKRGNLPLFLGFLGGVGAIAMAILVSAFRDSIGAFITFISLGGVCLGVMGVAFVFQMVYGMNAVNSLWKSKNDYLRAIPIKPAARILNMAIYHVITGVIFTLAIVVVSLIYASGISGDFILAEAVKYMSEISLGLLNIAAFVVMLYGVCWGATAFARNKGYSPVTAMIVVVIASFAILSLVTWRGNDIWRFNNSFYDIPSMAISFALGIVGMITAAMLFDPFEFTSKHNRGRYTFAITATVVGAIAVILINSVAGGIYSKVQYGETTTTTTQMQAPATEVLMKDKARHSNGQFETLKIILVPDDSSIVIKASDWARDSFVIDESNGQVTIEQKRYLPKGVECEIRIGVGDLSNLVSEGIANITSSDSIDCSSLSIYSEGIGAIRLGIENADHVKLTQDGIGETKLSGETASLNVKINGIGSADLRNLKAKDATVNSDGIGSCDVWATDTLNATLNGIGTISYWGDPTVNKNTNGLGTINHKGSK